jgi:multisubunit Na+/H+ antiporter MnhE subunit
MKWIFRVLMLIVLMLGYMCLQSAHGTGRLLFIGYTVGLLVLWGLHELQHPIDEKPKGSDGEL